MDERRKGLLADYLTNARSGLLGAPSRAVGGLLGAAYDYSPHTRQAADSLGRMGAALLEYASPAGDIAGTVESSKDTMSALRNRDYGGLLSGAGLTAAGLFGTMVPGTARGYAEGGMKGLELARKEADRLATLREVFDRAKAKARQNVSRWDDYTPDEQALIEWEMGLGPNAAAALKAARAGLPPPGEYVAGWRYGAAPDRALSYNELTGANELGLSMAEAVHPEASKWGGLSRIFIEEAARKEGRPQAWYTGYFSPKNVGGDDEPLLLFAKQHGSEDEAKSFAQAVADMLAGR